MGVGRVRHMAEEEEEGQGDGEETDELGVRRGHSVALAMHFCAMSVVRAKTSRRVHVRVRLPRGRSSLIQRFKIQLRASHAIWPVNISMISISRLLHIRVA